MFESRRREVMWGCKRRGERRGGGVGRGEEEMRGKGEK